jgi:hypothetical protein
MVAGLLLGGSLIWGTGCGDDSSGIPGCTPGARIDCGDGKEQVCNGGIWSACQDKSCTDGAVLNCTQSNGQAGQQVCQGGTWTACGPIPGQCEENTYRQCTTPENKEGYQHCQNGTWGSCVADNPPACQDGQTQACSTTCGTGSEVCVNGDWKNCNAPQPQQEVCDGFDNNCDGTVDEVCICVHGNCEACYTGTPATRGIGQCKDGQRCCDKGIWGECQNQVLPAAQENCADNIDNDCNGTVNDGCTCVVGTQSECGTDVGECSKGTKVCTLVSNNPEWGECIGNVAPKNEKNFGCDGLDNDCDGTSDNGLDADSDEQNDTCNNARPYIVHDSDLQATTLTMTLYPQGDVDYYKIQALEDTISFPFCCPWPICSDPDPQCNYLEVEITSPGGLVYEASILAGTCTAPSQVFTTTTKKIIHWDGVCGQDDSQDFWIKVQPASSSALTYSCLTYKLKFHYTRNNNQCS